MQYVTCMTQNWSYHPQKNNSSVCGNLPMAEVTPHEVTVQQGTIHVNGMMGLNGIVAV